VGATLAAALVSPAASSAGTGVQPIHGGRVIVDFRPNHPTAGTRTAAAQSTTVTHFSTTVKDGKKTFTYAMVGKNPFVKLATPSTTIATYLVPLKIVLANHATFDPTVHASCDAVSAEARTMQSPIVLSQAYSEGGTALGTGQYTDIFRRAEFFSQTGPAGINPGYHLKLNVVTLPVVTLKVPAADSAEFTSTACGERTAAVEINWFDQALTSTVLPSLKAQGVTVKTFPLFLLRDVVGYDTTTNNCCILGYHGDTQTAAGQQTYGVADYESSKRFSDALDVNTLAHEIGEWEDDPFGNNPTKPWGNIGQVTGCQSNLEVGDPLSGTSINVTTGGYTYHPQELAFFSWFYHQSPSLGVNGLYSNNGTFTSPAAPCH
jgi:hypothetical protein